MICGARVGEVMSEGFGMELLLLISCPAADEKEKIIGVKDCQNNLSKRLAPKSQFVGFDPTAFYDIYPAQ